MKIVSTEKIVNKFVEEYTETVQDVKIVENMHKCSSFILHIVLFSILLTINVGIGSYFFYSHCFLKKYITRET